MKKWTASHFPWASQGVFRNLASLGITGATNHSYVVTLTRPSEPSWKYEMQVDFDLEPLVTLLCKGSCVVTVKLPRPNQIEVGGQQSDA